MKQPLFSIALAALALTAAILSSSTSSYADDVDSILGLPSSTGTAATLPGGQPNGPPPTAVQGITMPSQYYPTIRAVCDTSVSPNYPNPSFFANFFYNGVNFYGFGVHNLLPSATVTYCLQHARNACGSALHVYGLGLPYADVQFFGNVMSGTFRCGTF